MKAFITAFALIATLTCAIEPRPTYRGFGSYGRRGGYGGYPNRRSNYGGYPNRRSSYGGYAGGFDFEQGDFGKNRSYKSSVAVKKDYGVWSNSYRLSAETFEQTVVQDTENVWVVAFM